MDLLKHLEHLKETRAMIATPERWTQQTYARNRAGHSVSQDDPSAVQWCLVGALGASMKNLALIRTCEAMFKARDRLRKYHDYPELESFNDSCRTRHHDVLLVLDAAIADAKDEAGGHWLP